MMRVRSILANIYTVLCVVLIAIGIVSLIAVMAGIRPFVMISESMHPEVPKGSLVFLDTRANMTDVAVGDNVAYVLGKVEAMHKVTAISTVSPASSDSANPGVMAESESGRKTVPVDNMSTETVENGESGKKTLVVKSLADEGTSVITPLTYLGKEVLHIPGVGGWIRSILNYRWVVIVVAVGLIVAGCIPRMRKDTATRQTVPRE